DYGGPSHQDQPGEALVHHDLRRTQHALIFALGEYDPTPRTFLRRVEERLHDEARVIDELQELCVVRVEIGDRTRGDARIHGRPRHRGRDFYDQARVERPGDQVFGSELQGLLAVGGSDDLRLLRHRKIGYSADRGELHGLVDSGRSDIECTAKDERKAQ